MLNTHDALRRIDGTKSIVGENFLILDVRDVDNYGLVGCGLETLKTVPGHVLDGEHCAVAENLKIEGAVGAVRT